MKTKIALVTFGFLLICLFSVAKEKGSSAISGQSLTELGQYTITSSPVAMNIGNEVLNTYKLVYSELDSPILIGVKKTGKCRNFIVRTDGFEVEYICNNHVFGVKKVNEKYREVGLDQIYAKLDLSQFYAQRVISQYPKTEEELLGLIASYFPSLLKEQFRINLSNTAMLELLTYLNVEQTQNYPELLVK